MGQTGSHKGNFLLNFLLLGVPDTRASGLLVKGLDCLQSKEEAIKSALTTVMLEAFRAAGRLQPHAEGSASDFTHTGSLRALSFSLCSFPGV